MLVGVDRHLYLAGSSGSGKNSALRGVSTSPSRLQSTSRYEVSSGRHLKSRSRLDGFCM